MVPLEVKRRRNYDSDYDEREKIDRFDYRESKV